MKMFSHFNILMIKIVGMFTMTTKLFLTASIVLHLGFFTGHTNAFMRLNVRAAATSPSMVAITNSFVKFESCPSTGPLNTSCNMRYAAVKAKFGPPMGKDLIGHYQAVSPQNACEDISPALLQSKKSIPYIAIINRENCSFELKVYNAERAGYRAVIIYANKEDKDLLNMSSSNPSLRVSIPSFFVSYATGTMLAYSSKLNNSSRPSLLLIALGKKTFLSSPPNFTGKLGAINANNGEEEEGDNFGEHYFHICIYIWACVVVSSLIGLSVKWGCCGRSLTRWEVTKIPLKRFRRDSGSDYQDKCPICHEEFHEGRLIRQLPCNHCYHSYCVDRWLVKMSNRCPLCKQRVSVSLFCSWSKQRDGKGEGLQQSDADLDAEASVGELPPLPPVQSLTPNTLYGDVIMSGPSKFILMRPGKVTRVIEVPKKESNAQSKQCIHPAIDSSSQLQPQQQQRQQQQQQQQKTCAIVSTSAPPPPPPPHCTGIRDNVALPLGPSDSKQLTTKQNDIDIVVGDYNYDYNIEIAHKLAIASSKDAVTGVDNVICMETLNHHDNHHHYNASYKSSRSSSITSDHPLLSEEDYNIYHRGGVGGGSTHAFSLPSEKDCGSAVVTDAVVMDKIGVKKQDFCNSSSSSRNSNKSGVLSVNKKKSEAITDYSIVCGDSVGNVGSSKDFRIGSKCKRSHSHHHHSHPHNPHPNHHHHHHQQHNRSRNVALEVNVNFSQRFQADIEQHCIPLHHHHHPQQKDNRDFLSLSEGGGSSKYINDDRDDNNVNDGYSSGVYSAFNLLRDDKTVVHRSVSDIGTRRKDHNIDDAGGGIISEFPCDNVVDGKFNGAANCGGGGDEGCYCNTADKLSQSQNVSQHCYSSSNNKKNKKNVGGGGGSGSVSVGCSGGVVGGGSGSHSLFQQWDNNRHNSVDPINTTTTTNTTCEIVTKKSRADTANRMGHPPSLFQIVTTCDNSLRRGRSCFPSRSGKNVRTL